MPANPGGLFSSIAPWLAALLALIIIGGIVMLWARRTVRRDGDASSPGFTLQDLRDMRDAGDISDEEFELARARMIERLRSASENTPPPVPDEGDA